MSKNGYIGYLENQVEHLTNKVDELTKEKNEAIKHGEDYYRDYKELFRVHKELSEKFESVERRLKHLLESDFIATFDKVNLISKQYVREIEIADRIHDEWIKLKAMELGRRVSERTNEASKSMNDLAKATKEFASTLSVKGDDEESSVVLLPRACSVEDDNYPKGVKVLCTFHRWVDKEEIIITFKEGGSFYCEKVREIFNKTGNIINLDGCVAKSCRVTTTYGLVEYPDGTMKYVKPEKITFKKDVVSL